MSDQNQILLHTKLCRPRLAHDLVMRSRLVEWLDTVLDQLLNLALLQAQ